jgi:hypothetical protein
MGKHKKAHPFILLLHEYYIYSFLLQLYYNFWQKLLQVFDIIASVVVRQI